MVDPEAFINYFGSKGIRGNFYYQEDRIYGMSKADKYFKAVCRWSCIEFLYLYEDKICLSDTV